jgi:hypothetical protein
MGGSGGIWNRRWVGTDSQRSHSAVLLFGGCADELLSSPRCSFDPITGEVECTIISLAPGETKIGQIAGHVPAGTPAGTEITNQIGVVSFTDDPAPGNNIAGGHRDRPRRDDPRSPIRSDHLGDRLDQRRLPVDTGHAPAFTNQLGITGNYNAAT